MKKKKPGPPMKAPGGLTAVLYVRVTQEMSDALDKLADQERGAFPGRSVSKADIARDFLLAGCRREGLMKP